MEIWTSSPESTNADATQLVTFLKKLHKQKAQIWGHQMPYLTLFKMTVSSINQAQYTHKEK